MAFFLKENDGLLQLSLRMFTLNPLAHCACLTVILRKVIMNVVSHPDEPKYRTVKLSNKIIQQKIVSLHGGVEFLRSMNFRRATEQREQLLRIADGNVDISWLELGVATLDSFSAGLKVSTTSTSTLTSTSTSNATKRPMAPCTLQIVLPTGHTIRAGFELDETVEDVYNFVDYCRTDGARQSGIESFMLVDASTSPPCELTNELRKQSLREAGMAPRCKLLIKKEKRRDAPGVFQDRPDDKIAREEADRVERDRQDVMEKLMLEKKRAEREAIKMERERAIHSFHEDRKDADRRADFELRKQARLDYEAGWRQRINMVSREEETQVISTMQQEVEQVEQVEQVVEKTKTTPEVNEEPTGEKK